MVKSKVKKAKASALRKKTLKRLPKKEMKEEFEKYMVNGFNQYSILTKPKNYEELKDASVIYTRFGYCCRVIHFKKTLLHQHDYIILEDAMRSRKIFKGDINLNEFLIRMDVCDLAVAVARMWNGARFLYERLKVYGGK